MNRHLILMGYMGSGKSSLGVALSYRMKRCLIDTDKWIEQREGLTVNELFARYGEEYFREAETQCLRELLAEKTPRVVALGGGTPLREENRALMKELGFCVYLKARPETIYERLRGDDTRPLLQCGDPGARIREMMALRDPVYTGAADYIVEVDHGRTPLLVNQIEEAYRNETSGD